MEGTTLKLLALGIALLLLATGVFASNEIFYLRGSSETETVGSSTYYEISAIAPSSATATTISKTISVGTNKFNEWFTGEATGPFTVSGSAFLYFSGIGVSGGSAKYRWSIYDYNSADQSYSLIVQSNFYTAPSPASKHETYVSLPLYTFQVGHRAKLLIEYQATNAGGTISAIVDEPSSTQSITYNSSNGNTYSVGNSGNAALLIVNTTGSCTIACTSDNGCDDSSPTTTDSCSSAGGCNSSCLNLAPSSSIECSSNADCNDSNSSTTDACVSPGTTSSLCTHAISGSDSNGSQALVCSSDSDCNDSNSSTTDACINPGTTSSSCSNTACSVRCDSASDCNDNDPSTTDSCSNPGTCNARCNYVQVIVASCTSNSECDDSNPETADYCFRAGASNAGCGNLDCKVECSTNSDCDDGDSSTSDICAGAGRCTASCYHLTSCGNGTVDGGETPCNCPQDAGVCGGTPGPTCTEFACIGSSCRQVVAIGCCGNNSCEFRENYSNCPMDCSPRNYSFEITGLGEDVKYLKGDTAKILVSVTGDGVEIKDAKLYLEGFFGRINLFNDGKHNDGKDFDNVYGNSIPITAGYEAKLHEIKLVVEFADDKYAETKLLNIDSKLSLDVAADKEKYALGDNITLTGKLMRGSIPISQDIDLNIVADGKLLIKKLLKSGDDGSFSFSYHTSIVEPSIGWRITAYTYDNSGNFGYVEKDLNFTSAKITDFLTLSLAKEIMESYERDDKVEIEVSLVDDSGNKVSGADVSSVTPLGDIVGLKESQPGMYGAFFTISRNFPIGLHEMKINASRIDANHVYGGSLVFDFNVQGISLNIELIEPVRSTFMVGDDAVFKAKVTYPDNEPLIAPDLNAFVNGKKVIMKAVDKGLYVGSYPVDETDNKGIDFTISVDDSFGNSGNAKTAFQVSGVSFFYYIKKYFSSLAIAGIALAIAAVMLLISLSWRLSFQNMTKKEKQIIEKIKGTQIQYFKEGAIDRRTYDSEMQKFEAELEETKKGLLILEKKLGLKK